MQQLKVRSNSSKHSRLRITVVKDTNVEELIATKIMTIKVLFYETGKGKLFSHIFILRNICAVFPKESEITVVWRTSRACGDLKYFSEKFQSFSYFSWIWDLGLGLGHDNSLTFSFPSLNSWKLFFQGSLTNLIEADIPM